jgi:hypothetical protein
MKKFATLAIITFAAFVHAQSTTVSTTGVVDTDSQAWAGGTYTISFVPSGGLSPAAYNWNGGTMVGHTQFTGSLNSSGAFSVAIPSNALIYPGGTQWNVQVCPNATSGCVSLNTAVSGTTQSLTTALNAIAAGPRFSANPWAFGYSTVEVVTAIKPGALFYNTSVGASPACNQWTGSTWASCSPSAAVVNTCTSASVSNYTAAFCTVTLSSAQLLAFDGTSATAVTAILAPGSGKRIDVGLNVTVEYVAGTTPFVGTNPEAFTFVYASAPSVLTFDCNTSPDFTAATSQVADCANLGTNANNATDANNSAIKVFPNSNILTLGNGSAVLIIPYTVVPIT